MIYDINSINKKRSPWIEYNSVFDCNKLEAGGDPWSFETKRKKIEDMKIFLGGTCNNSTWRDKLIPLLEDIGMNYFNPIVGNLTYEDIIKENKEKEICDINLFIISPLMDGVYPIAEIVDLSNKSSYKVLFVIANEDIKEDGSIIKFDNAQYKSLSNTVKLVQNNGVKTLYIQNAIDKENLDLVIQSLLEM